MPLNYTTRAGDCLSSIAARHGFRDYRSIYDDAANTTLRRARPNPNQLQPGDQVVIPDKQPRMAHGAAGRRHTFVAQSHPTFLRLRVVYRAALDYELDVEGDVHRGVTDGASLIVQPIAPTAASGVLTLWPASSARGPLLVRGEGLRFSLELGLLYPIDHLRGVQGRLANLGVYQGPVDGVDRPESREAISAFQVTHGLAPSGQVTPGFAALLVQEHDDP